jgi:hypothetical protein
VFTGSGSLLLHPSEFIESRNEADAILGGLGNQGSCKLGTRVKRLLDVFAEPVCGVEMADGRESGRKQRPGLQPNPREKLLESRSRRQRWTGLGSPA